MKLSLIFNLFTNLRNQNIQNTNEFKFILIKNNKFMLLIYIKKFIHVMKIQQK